MFGLIRLVIFVALAFTAGVMKERYNQKTLCSELGGTWVSAGFCKGP